MDEVFVIVVASDGAEFAIRGELFVFIKNHENGTAPRFSWFANPAPEFVVCFIVAASDVAAPRGLGLDFREHGFAGAGLGVLGGATVREDEGRTESGEGEGSGQGHR